jgi:hypothetical protein
MQSKDYQTNVLATLSKYLEVLATRRERAEKVAKFLAD